MNKRVQIEAGWEGAGRQGTVIGDGTTYVAHNGEEWTPVKWDNEEGPNWYISGGLEDISDKPKINTANLFMIGRQGEDIVIGRFPGSRRLSREEALNFAAWLVAIADTGDAHEDFKEILEAIENT